MFLLKPLRVIAALLFFSVMTLFFLDFTGSLPTELHVLAQVQMIPALLSGVLGIFAIWIVLTFLFGRLYCSVICPLGVAQDAIARSAKTIHPRKKYRFKQTNPILRYGLLALLVIGLFFPLPILVTLLDPYSHFGRITVSLLRPIVLLGNNILAGITHAWGNYTLFFMPINVSIQTILIALAALFLIGFMSWFSGRRFCNSLCPIGTLLGLFSRNSVFRIRLNANCTGCTLCETRCKGECIDSKNQSVHADRCVACFNCLSACKKNAIVYGIRQQTKILSGNRMVSEPNKCLVKQSSLTGIGQERRLILARLLWTVLGLVSVPGFLRAAISDFSKVGTTELKELPLGESRVSYQLTHPVFPPGGLDINRFHRRCNGCQLCISKCPSGILVPASMEYGWNGFQQPVVTFQKGFCNYDCTICTEVCATHALQRLSQEEKHLTQIGQVHFLEENCVVKTQETNCGACAEHCPTGAVKMVAYGPPELKLTIPEITQEFCVGCGACEYICPVRPYRAIYVDGNAIHQKAKLSYDPNATQEVLKVEDFGF